MALTTTAEYKSWRGVTSSGWDTIYTTLIGAAQAEIERLCGRTAGGFESASFTETLDGDGSNTIKVSNGPITAISSVSVGNSSPTTLTSSSYVFNDRTITLIGSDPGWNDADGGVFTQGAQNVAVAYTGGYATVPDDLKLVCWRFVDHYAAQRGHDFEQLSTAQGNTNFTHRADADFTARMLGMLRPWRDLR